jgi:hypothetical protein
MNISHSKTASTAPVLSAPAWSSKQQQQHSQHRMSAQELQLRGMPAPGEGWDDQQEWLLHQLKSHQQQQVQHMRVICLVQQGYTVYWQRVQCNVLFLLVFVMFYTTRVQEQDKTRHQYGWVLETCVLQGQKCFKATKAAKRLECKLWDRYTHATPPAVLASASACPMQHEPCTIPPSVA